VELDVRRYCSRLTQPWWRLERPLRVNISISGDSYGPPSHPGTRHGRCQAETGRESRYVCFPAISAASPLGGRHGG
jgi:hypothetical protein